MKEIKGTSPLDTYEIATGQTPAEDDLAVINAAGKIVEADDVTGVKVVGVIEGIDADGKVYVRSAIVLRANGSTSLARADRGSKCFVVDGATVAKTGTVVAGTVIDVTAAGVFVDTSPTAMKDVTAAEVHIADVAAVTQNALTLTSMTGTANTAPAADTVPTKLTGTLTGTVNGALVDVAATAGACAGSTTPSASNVDTAIATAVATIVTGTNEQLKELQTSLAAAIDLCTVLVNNNKTFATELNAAKADNAAQVTKINALIAALETAGIVKTA